MQNYSSIRRFLNYTNKNRLINTIYYTKNNNFSSANTDSKFSISHIDLLGKEFKNNRERINSSIKPKTLNEIKKIQNFVKTTNADNDLEE